MTIVECFSNDFNLQGGRENVRHNVGCRTRNVLPVALVIIRTILNVIVRQMPLNDRGAALNCLSSIYVCN